MSSTGFYKGNILQKRRESFNLEKWFQPAGYLGLLPNWDHITPIFGHFKHGTARRDAQQEDQEDQNYGHFVQVFLLSEREEQREEMRGLSTVHSTTAKHSLTGH